MSASAACPSRSPEAVIPDELQGCEKVETATLKDVPSKEALAAFLLQKGLDTKDWGQRNTKDIGKYWKEIKLDEAGLEVWKKANGELQPIRTVHVLRAKVSSPEAYKKGIFLFNTWQQYGDGRKRTRNGLLSEKLAMSELPFEEHIHEICERAVTEEEMQRLAESALRIGPHSPAPKYDSSYICPLKVVKEHFVDHTIEIEISKSYPGLLTMYHLYTVDIICTGLPSVDFNTLEFEHEDDQGNRALKYVHAWVWLCWPQIQRYLLEGSVLKETKKRGSFKDVDAFYSWLSQFDLDLDSWGKGQWRAVRDLYDEVEKEACSLELWGRQDGVPLLMRVVHVIQIQVASSDPRLFGKHLLHMWTQHPDGHVTTQHRLLAKKLDSVADKKSSKDPSQKFDKDRFVSAATQCIIDQFEYLSDAHHQLDENEEACKSELEHSNVKALRVEVTDQRSDVEESPSFKGMHTMYHLYTMEAICENLPDAEFTSIDFTKRKPLVHGWRWVTWHQTMDIYNAAKQGTTRREAARQRVVDSVDTSAMPLADLALAMQKLAAKYGDDADVQMAKAQLELLQQQVGNLRESFKHGNNDNASALLPPSMISKMAAETIATDNFAEEVEEMRMAKALSWRQAVKEDVKEVAK
jgi:hypothetical protein